MLERKTKHQHINKPQNKRKSRCYSYHSGLRGQGTHPKEQKSRCHFYLSGLREGDHCEINCCFEKLKSGRLLNIIIKLGRMVESSRCVSIVEATLPLVVNWLKCNVICEQQYYCFVDYEPNYSVYYNWISRFNNAAASETLHHPTKTIRLLNFSLAFW